MGELPSSDEDFHRLVDSIYESALDVTMLPEALDRFSQYTCTEQPRYLVWDKLAGAARLGVTQHGCFAPQGGGLPEPLHSLAQLPGSGLASVSGSFTDLSPAGPGTATGAALCSQAELARGVRLYDSDEVCVLMSGARARYAGLDDHHRRRRLAQVLPHWARAARLQQRNVELSGLAALGLASLDTLDFGVMVLQGDLRVRYSNRWAETIVQTDAKLALEDGRLRAHDDTLQSVLRELLDSAMQGHSGGGSAGSWMHVTSGGQPVPLIVMPLLSRQPLEEPWQLPCAMLLMGNSESRSVLDTAVLGSLFGLSRKESIVAIRLAAGETLNEIAEGEFLSPHTVRVHIRDILRKTGTHRQAELVRLLHLLPGVDLERAGVLNSAGPRARRATPA